MSGSNVRDIERAESAPLTVLIIGTLDTKTVELSALAAEVEQLGAIPILLDSSGREPENQPPGDWRIIDRGQVAAAAGTSTEYINALPRGEAIDVIRDGVRSITEKLQASGQIHAAISMGGAGTHVVGPVFAELPIGFPKLIVSPLASGARTFEAYVGLRDVAVLHSVADIMGINSITTEIYRTAAGYIVGAARAAQNRPAGVSKPVIAVSMNGNTTAPLVRAKYRLEERGYSVVAFHANGVGGRALESFAASGHTVGVLDYTTTELAAHLVGGLMDAGGTRMEAAARAGIPQVLVPGCLDFITCGRWEDAQREFPGRVMFRHNPELTLVRLTAQETAELGRTFARKANLATGPVTVCFPLGGLSINDHEGGLFWEPAANRALLEALRAELSPSNKLVVLSEHITADSFIDRAVTELLQLLPDPPAEGPGVYGRPEPTYTYLV